jgi:tetratricopeptide (TPR) repeat protein
MGFFGKTDPLAQLTAQVEKRPKDVKLVLDLANMLKAKGAQSAAVENFRKAMDLYVEQGFMPKALAIAKQVTSFAPNEIEPYEFLAEHYEKNNLKEELRLTLKTLVRLYGENARQDDADRARNKMSSLGPGR